MCLFDAGGVLREERSVEVKTKLSFVCDVNVACAPLVVQERMTQVVAFIISYLP